LERNLKREVEDEKTRAVIAEQERLKMSEEIRKVHKEGTEGMLLEVMLGGTDGLIERQEARGQRSLVNSSQLPTSGTPGTTVRGRPMSKEVEEAWAATGIEFGPIVEGELFRDSVLPEGWSKSCTDHAMHSDLLDDKGRKRASIFYKAAFYDRRADISLTMRFQVSEDWEGRKDIGMFDGYDVVYRVLDCEKEVFRSKGYSIPSHPRGEDGKNEVSEDSWSAYEMARCDSEEKARDECEAWLIENGFADWKKVGAHWS